jgi:hypothetical protein
MIKHLCMIFAPSPSEFDQLPATVLLSIPEASASFELQNELDSRPERTIAVRSRFPRWDEVVFLPPFSDL